MARTGLSLDPGATGEGPTCTPAVAALNQSGALLSPLALGVARCAAFSSAWTRAAFATAPLSGAGGAAGVRFRTSTAPVDGRGLGGWRTTGAATIAPPDSQARSIRDTTRALTFSPDRAANSSTAAHSSTGARIDFGVVLIRGSGAVTQSTPCNTTRPPVLQARRPLAYIRFHPRNSLRARREATASPYAACLESAGGATVRNWIVRGGGVRWLERGLRLGEGEYAPARANALARLILFPAPVLRPEPLTLTRDPQPLEIRP